MPHLDKRLTCRDCHATFTFTAGEQDFYASRGLSNEPTRCAGCRSARKLNAGAAAPAVQSYVHYGAAASFGGRTPRQMHPATCSQCGQLTEVPFLPRGERPVFCSECYSAVRPAMDQQRHAAAG